MPSDSLAEQVLTAALFFRYSILKQLLLASFSIENRHRCDFDPSWKACSLIALYKLGSIQTSVLESEEEADKN